MSPWVASDRDFHSVSNFNMPGTLAKRGGVTSVPFDLVLKSLDLSEY